MTDCKIYLENNDRAVYVAGQILRGTIELYLEEPKKINGLCFIVNGVARCHWTETVDEEVGTGDNRRTETKTIHYNGEEVYLNQRTYLFGSKGANAVEVAAGVYRYNFECQLPPQLPASLEASMGSIRYDIEAVLDIPWRFDREFKLLFCVTRCDNLNDFPELALPCNHEKVRRFCYFFCQSVPFIFTVTMPCTGFVPGQVIPVSITSHNKSNTNVEQTRIILVRKTQFNSSTPISSSKYETEKIVKDIQSGIASGGDVSFDTQILVPQTAMTSNTMFCGVVQVSYEVKIEAIVAGCHRNVSLAIPIVIGTIPLDLNNSSTFPNASPPTFEEALSEDFTDFNDQQPSLGWNVQSTTPSAPPEF